MNARDELLMEVISGLESGDFRRQGDTEADANALIDAFAHELAEKIREAKDERDAYAVQYGMNLAADLIDPAKESDHAQQ